MHGPAKEMSDTLLILLFLFLKKLALAFHLNVVFQTHDARGKPSLEQQAAHSHAVDLVALHHLSSLCSVPGTEGTIAIYFVLFQFRVVLS